MAWTPPETLEETAKRLLVPPGLYARYKYAKELRRGEREIRLAPFLADPRRAAIDAGANKGVWTYALLKAGCREVHAFEPNPKQFAVLQSWAKDRAHLHPIALSDTAGEATLMVPKGAGGYSNQGASLSTIKVGAQPFGAVTVEARPLDHHGVENVGFLKKDVEGFELQVLKKYQPSGLTGRGGSPATGPTWSSRWRSSTPSAACPR